MPLNIGAPYSGLNGHNPLRYHCWERDACYVEHMKARIEMFAECFPGKIAFTDIDYRVEINRHFLEMEFKRPGEILRTGQRIAFQGLTALLPKSYLVLIVEAEPRADIVYNYVAIRNGVVSERRSCDLDGLKQRVSEWAAWAQKRR